MKKELLIVEDEAISRFVITEMCAKLGYECTVVEDGQQCLDEIAVAPERYSLVFMDIHMPKVSGLAASAAIRGAHTDPPRNTPIIAVTADPHWHNVQRCKDQGFDDVLSKPITMDGLTATLHQFLD